MKPPPTDFGSRFSDLKTPQQEHHPDGRVDHVQAEQNPESVPEIHGAAHIRFDGQVDDRDQIQCVNGDHQKIDYLVPIVADAEAGFGGNLNAFELMKSMIESGASGVHFEDQLSSAKKCGHLGGKVLVPTQEAINKLVAARLAADVMGTPTLIIARTDADAANLITSDIDCRDQQFITGERTGVHSDSIF